jgi:hypothetical protein
MIRSQSENGGGDGGDGGDGRETRPRRKRYVRDKIINEREAAH